MKKKMMLGLFLVLGMLPVNHDAKADNYNVLFCGGDQYEGSNGSYTIYIQDQCVLQDVQHPNQTPECTIQYDQSYGSNSPANSCTPGTGGSTLGANNCPAPGLVCNTMIEDTCEAYGGRRARRPSRSRRTAYRRL